MKNIVREETIEKLALSWMFLLDYYLSNPSLTCTGIILERKSAKNFVAGHKWDNVGLSIEIYWN